MAAGTRKARKTALLPPRERFAMAAADAPPRGGRALGRLGDRVRGEVERVHEGRATQPRLFPLGNFHVLLRELAEEVPFAARPARGPRRAPRRRRRPLPRRRRHGPLRRRGAEPGAGSGPRRQGRPRRDGVLRERRRERLVGPREEP